MHAPASDEGLEIEGDGINSKAGYKFKGIKTKKGPFNLTHKK